MELITANNELPKGTAMGKTLTHTECAHCRVKGMTTMIKTGDSRRSRVDTPLMNDWEKAMKSTVSAVVKRAIIATVSVASGLLGASGLVLAHTRQDIPNLKNVEVVSVKANGSGCKQGVGADAYFDGEALVVDAADLYAVRGEGHRRSEARSICQLIVELDVPEGWVYAVAAVDGATDTVLSAGMEAHAKFTAYFSAADAQAVAEVSRFSDAFVSDLFYEEMDQVLFSPCDTMRPLKIKKALRVKASASKTSRGFGKSRKSRSDSYAAVEFDGPVRFVLNWKRCADQGL